MAGGAELREVARDELPALAPLVERVLGAALDVAVGDFLAPELSAAAAAYDPALDLFLAAQVEGRTVGGLVMTHAGTGASAIPLVAWLVVDPCQAQRGIGRQLLSRAVAACRERGAPAIDARTLAASPAGPRLLWRLGFRVAELSAVSFGGRTRELLLFRLPLAPARAAAAETSEPSRHATPPALPDGAEPGLA